VPTPGHLGSWHFGALSAGGEGQIDYAGTCVQNRLRFIVVGGGTMAIQTVAHPSGTRELSVRLFHFDPVAGTTLDATYYITSGESVELPVSSHGGTTCIHWIDVMDRHIVCGGKWGWSGMTWSTE
jgi:hypothetical protein